MRRLALAAALLGCVSCTALAAQQLAPSSDPVLVPLQHGPLVVWIVYPAPPRLRAGDPVFFDKYNEQTPSTLGQSASTMGHNAGDVGQAPSTLPSPGDASKTAGDTGQTAGSFGESLGTIAAAAAAANGSNPRPDRDGVAPTHDPVWDAFADQVRHAFPELQVSFVEVTADELQQRLKDAQAAHALPDVFVAGRLPTSDVLRSFGTMTLAKTAWIQQTEADDAPDSTGPEVLIFQLAPHPVAARAFAVWISDGGGCSGCRDLPGETGTPVAVATAALRDVLQGEALGSIADPEMAPFDAVQARSVALLLDQETSQAAIHAVGRSTGLGKLDVRVDVTDAQANGRFAVVELRAVVSQGAAFGVVHALVVLRTDEQKQWRVLHLSPNLRTEQQESAWDLLQAYAQEVDKVATVAGVSQAAPVDGDNRPARPDLWWDNGGGATLEVVEWQSRTAHGWTISNLYFVPDVDGRLKTRVTANFASAQQGYRWRIWSVGAGGALALSPWRTLNIVSR